MAATSSNGEILNRNASGSASGANSIGDSKSSLQQNSGMKTETGEMELEGMSVEKAGEYVRELLLEKQSLDSSQWPHALRLLDQEVTKEVAQVQAMGKPIPKESKYVDIYREKPIRVAVKVLVPIKEHPKFNFVGKLLGPKGNSMKRLQEDTMTKMAVLGRGSMKDKQKEEELRASLDPKYAHLSDDLHVEITAFAPPAEAHARIAYALAELRKYLIPDSNDEIRQEQMREMELIQTVVEPGPNGTPQSVRRVVRGGGVVGGGVSRGRGLPLRGGAVGVGAPGVTAAAAAAAALRGAGAGLAMRGGGVGAGGGRGLLSPPPGSMMPPRGVPPAGVRKPMPPPPPPPSLLPRPVPSKTKVMSILDRARVAMEESYAGEEEVAAGGEGGFYESYDTYNAAGYTGYDDYDEGPADYYAPGDAYPDDTTNRWKGFKAPSAGLATDRAPRFRPAPYTRPTK